MKMCEALLGQSSMEAYALLYEVSKIFNISTGLSLPPFLKNEAVLDNFYKLVSLSLPTASFSSCRTFCPCQVTQAVDASLSLSWCLLLLLPRTE